MEYCTRCGSVWADDSNYYQVNNKKWCDTCGNLNIKDDGVTGEMYSSMSQEEKDNYVKHLVHIIENSEDLDVRMWNMYNNPQKTANFYCSFDYDRYESLTGKSACRKWTEEEIQKHNEYLQKTYGKGSKLHEEEILRRAIQADTERKNQNKPKCPTCGSINIEKISLGKKAVGGALFGLFSSNVRNSMHCKNCGYKW